MVKIKGEFCRWPGNIFEGEQLDSCYLKIESVQKVIDYTLKIKKPTDRRHMQLNFYRSKYFKMPSFLSYNSSKDMVPNQGSVEILDPDRGHIML